MSQKIRWGIIKEDTQSQPLTSTHMCTHITRIHTHIPKNTLNNEGNLYPDLYACCTIILLFILNELSVLVN